MRPVHKKVWKQLDKRNKKFKVKKLADYFFKQLTSK